MKNASVNKLHSITNFLKVSSKFNFINFNLPIFLDFLKKDFEISIIINELISKYPHIKSDAKEAVDSAKITGLADYESWVAFCLFYLMEAGANRGNKLITNFVRETGAKEDNEGLSPKIQFFNDCIVPLVTYIELKIEFYLSAIKALKRYKIYCEWYDRKELPKLLEIGEVEVTKNHLSRFLFDQGFTYVFWETNTPSGRIDNLALNIGTINPKELPSIVVVEGKIFKGDKIALNIVRKQIHKRINELNVPEGFCVIFNESNKKIIFDDSNGYVDEFPYINDDNKRIYFIIINLNDDFYKSNASINEFHLKIKEGSCQ